MPDIEITKDCYIIRYVGMGDVDIIPDLNKKGTILKDTSFPSNGKKVTTLELKEELEQHGIGTDFLSGTNYEYDGITLQPFTAGGLIPIGCFKVLNTQ